MEKKFIYSDVEIYSDGENTWDIVGYTNDNAEGSILGSINIKGEINWVCEEAQNDILVQTEINDFRKDRFFSETEDYEKIVVIFKKVFDSLQNRKYAEIGIDIISPDGITTYGINKLTILGNERYAFGLMGVNDFRMCEINDDIDIESITSFIYSDIVSAVGDVFVIDFVD